MPIEERRETYQRLINEAMEMAEHGFASKVIQQYAAELKRHGKPIDALKVLRQADGLPRVLPGIYAVIVRQEISLMMELGRLDEAWERLKTVFNKRGVPLAQYAHMVLLLGGYMAAQGRKGSAIECFQFYVRLCEMVAFLEKEKVYQGSAWHWLMLQAPDWIIQIWQSKEGDLRELVAPAIVQLCEVQRQYRSLAMPTDTVYYFLHEVAEWLEAQGNQSQAAVVRAVIELSDEKGEESEPMV